MVGTHIAHYEITAKLGQGGMGEVYRATDTKLDREVAIKVLPVAVSQDAERLARFEREAKTLAALNHPNIAGIFGLEHEGEMQALVLELVEGEDLSSVLQHGPLPVTEALEVAREIAKGLEVAHEKGIVHRDLKPGNVKYLEEGEVKVLDFGLAKALAEESDLDLELVGRASPRAESAEGDGSRGRSPHREEMSPDESPTLTDVFTQPGTILGTAAYMSPEQARGKVIDRRADVWSFGCVLFECLTGKKAFKGEDTTETLAAIIKGEPDWDRLPEATPPTISLLLRRCLAKDRKRRLRDMSDIRIELDDAIDGSSSSVGVSLADSTAPATQPAWGMIHFIAIVVAVLFAVILTATLGRLIESPEPATFERPGPYRMIELALPNSTHEHHRTRTLISPDGLKILFQERRGLYLHDLTTMSTRKLPVAEFSPKPFWSPDSQAIGFFAEHPGVGVMYRLNLDASEPLVIAKLSDDFNMNPWTRGGAAWLPNGEILFCVAKSGDGAGLWRVPASAGEPERVLELGEGEVSFRMPSPLPDGTGVVFLVQSEGGGVDKVAIYSRGERQTVFELPGETIESALVDRSGYLLYDRSTSNPGIWAVALSTLKGEAGEAKPFKIADGSDPSLSLDGTLLLLEGTFVHDRSGHRLVWLHLDGAVEPIEGMPVHPMGYSVSLSEKEDQALVPVWDKETDASSIWRQRLDRPGVENQVSFPGSNEGDWHPIWHSDGEHFFFLRARGIGKSARDLPMSILKARLDGQGKPVELAKGVYYSVSRDSRYLVYQSTRSADSDQQIVAFLDFEQADPKPQLLPGANAGRYRRPLLSPDGRYLAFMKTQSGNPGYFLTRFPSGEGEWLISGEASSRGFWGADPIQAAFYAYTPTGSLVSEKRVILPQNGGVPVFGETRKFYNVNDKHFHHYAGPAPSRDGERFLIQQEADIETLRNRKVILKINWAQQFNQELSL